MGNFRRLSDSEEVLKAAKFMVATQISRDPLVRKTVRAVFYERALLNVSPTKKGFKEIDESHPVYRFLINAMWLLQSPATKELTYFILCTFILE